ncbi:neuronal PAS domain-containing protein 2 [Latimeria chalumnae]|uniref:neuronal PAS domain-containing protein 2 n=1 Tax=Latimeria chalumnae TaxID=7897 RepID=UPI00313C69B6
MDEDEKDRAKRASRNKSEKKRRDQFNVLIKELCTMLQGQGHPRKMDKSTILQRTINFLQKQKEITAQTEASEIRQDWKPSFLTNEEFTQLMLEALDGFLIALTTDGNIIYVSDNVSSLLGHLPSDLVDQNILNFLPEREHSEVYKLLSTHMLLSDPVTAEFLNTEKNIEFCCHLARGTLVPNEPPTYEYVKFVVDFTFHNHVPISSCNGFELAFARTSKSAPEDQVCLVATVRLVTPQFLKELCTVEEPYAEFTSRYSLEWKFLFLDHRAPPIIGYLPFEVLGTSGYDYYHADDLELLARCHEHLMQFGKGKSCYYRFLTKGQQWIWLQTHYYITYHQWNSKPEFIVCTHTVVSYAEVRAERRQQLGLEESALKMTSSLKAQNCYVDLRKSGSAQEISRDKLSASSQSSRKSSHTALSDSASTASLRHTDASTPSRQSATIAPQASSDQLPQQIIPQPAVSSQQALMYLSMGCHTLAQALTTPFSPWWSLVKLKIVQEHHIQVFPGTGKGSQELIQPITVTFKKYLTAESPLIFAGHSEHNGFFIVLRLVYTSKTISLNVRLLCTKYTKYCTITKYIQPLYQFPAQLGMMHQLKEQLEERTRMLQADIKTQQEELHSIKEQLQFVQDSNLQILLQQPVPLGFNSLQHQGPGKSQQQPGVSRQASSLTKQSQGLIRSEQFCDPNVPSSHQFLRDTMMATTQAQQQVLRGNLLQQTCLPVHTYANLSMPLYSNPMMLSQTNSMTVPASIPSDVNQRHPLSDYCQERHLRMLLNQTTQSMMQWNNGIGQSSQDSSTRQQTKYVQDQQMLPPTLPMQPMTCGTVLVPSPMFTASVMIPPSTFTSHPPCPPVHHQQTQHSMQLQQHHHYLQT